MCIRDRVNTVEREGISYSHPARFILVGTMNPEEGDLRPQLLDRFGLMVEVHEMCIRDSPPAPQRIPAASDREWRSSAVQPDRPCGV